MNGYTHQPSSENQSIGGSDATPVKRKNEDGSQTHTRAKRNRYISIACNECKRRKIKCNGQVPCERCGNLSLECLYAPNCCTGGFKDSEEFRQITSHIQSLQEQVDHLYASLSNLRGPAESILPRNEADSYTGRRSPQDSNSIPFPDSKPSPRPREQHSHYQGPTSSTFNFHIAKSSLQTMGITANEDGADDEITPYEGPATPLQHHPPIASMIMPPSKEPLWSIEKDEALRLCGVYDEELGTMFPSFDMEAVVDKARLLFSFIESAQRTGLIQRNRPGADALSGADTNILKMVMATAMVIEGGGPCDLASRLYDSVRGATASKLWEPVDLKGLTLLIIVAQYHYQIDEEAQSYRIIGLAARMCLEMGLHCRDVLNKFYKSGDEGSWVVKLFWCIYVLDRRWSFGTGMPYSLQDADIDPLLPEPDSSTPYLTAMVSYGRLSTKVWRSVGGLDGIVNEINRDEIGYLDYQLLQWSKNLPESHKYNPSNDDRETESNPNGGLRRLRILLYVRANQMRILIHRPVLHSATSIMENRGHAQTVVEVAKDTIRMLSRLDQTSNIYRRQQVCFNYFLVSALGVLFLAVSHAPVEFSRQVRDEFYMALDLVKGFSSKSYISKRLWKTIRGLKKVGPKLGLVSRQPITDANDPHSSAAVAMAGLAGHPVDETAMFPYATPSTLANSPLDGQQMSRELTNLFEAAGGYGNLMPVTGHGNEGVNGFAGSQGEVPQGVEGIPGMYGNEEEFSRIMRDLF